MEKNIEDIIWLNQDLVTLKCTKLLLGCIYRANIFVVTIIKGESGMVMRDVCLIGIVLGDGKSS